MNRITVLSIIGLALLNVLLPANQASAQSAKMEIILVEASNSAKGVDKSLAPYASTLKRLFKFDTYRKASSSRINLDIPGSGSARLGGEGGSLKVSAESLKGNAIRAGLNWTRGNRQLLHTRLQLRKGTPAVLGGPRSGDGSYLLLIIWK